MNLSHEIRTNLKQSSLKHLKRLGLHQKVHLHLHGRIFEAGHVIKPGPRHEIKINRKTALVFADHAPDSNWGHPCQFLLHDAESGEMYDTVDARFPSFDFLHSPHHYETFHTPVNHALAHAPSRPDSNDPSAGIAKTDITSLPAKTGYSMTGINIPGAKAGNSHAILFSGNSYYRHVNDLEFLYRTLVHQYGFPKENIHVLNRDGTISYFPDGTNPPDITQGIWPGIDGRSGSPYEMVVTATGSKDDLEKTMDIVSQKIQPDDFLFIYMGNHGGGSGRTGTRPPYYLCCYNAKGLWEVYNADDFAGKLKAMPPFGTLMVIMDQCHSGGFVDPIMNNSPAKITYAAAACKADKSSAGGKYMDPFTQWWTSGVSNQRLSAKDAFAFAKEEDIKNGIRQKQSTLDTPLEKDKPGGCGSEIYLD